MLINFKSDVGYIYKLNLKTEKSILVQLRSSNTPDQRWEQYKQPLIIHHDMQPNHLKALIILHLKLVVQWYS